MVLLWKIICSIVLDYGRRMVRGYRLPGGLDIASSVGSWVHGSHSGWFSSVDISAVVDILQRMFCVDIRRKPFYSIGVSCCRSAVLFWFWYLLLQQA